MPSAKHTSSAAKSASTPSSKVRTSVSKLASKPAPTSASKSASKSMPSASRSALKSRLQSRSSAAASPSRSSLKSRLQSRSLAAASPSPARRQSSSLVVASEARTKLQSASLVAASPRPLKRRRSDPNAGSLVCKDAGPPQPKCEPEPVIKVLRDLLDLWRAACKDEEQGFLLMSSVASMAEAALSGAGSELLRAWDRAKEQEVSAQELQLAGERARWELEAELQQSGSTIEERRQHFATNAQTFKQRARVVRDARAAKEELEAELGVAAGQSTLLARLQEEFLKPLVEGVEGEAEANRLVLSLMSALRSFDLEASIAEALPEVLKKGPEDRSSADKEVVEKLGKTLSRCAAALQDTLGQAEQERTARTAAVAAAEDAFEAASAKQQGGARRLWGSKAEQKASQEALERARVEARALEERRQAASRVSGAAAERWFTALRCGPLTAYLAQREQRDQTLEPLPLQES